MPQLPPDSHGGHTAKSRRLRRETTASERVMWEMLRTCGFKFRRQHAAGSYVLDFYCAEARLRVEVDGPMHNAEADRRRDLALQEMGVETVRVPSGELFEETATGRSAWLKSVVAACERRSGRPFHARPSRRHGKH